MRQRLLLVALIVIALLPRFAPAAAQDGAQRVELDAADGLRLVGLYYPAPAQPDAEAAPAVLLMHHSGSQKEAWIDLIPALQDAGYAALTVDLRGHGETGGSVDWVLAEDDAQRWLDWLRAQPGIDPDRASIVGASIGADVGLRVMAQDDRLTTLVGLSVGLNVQGVNTEEAVRSLGGRPLFLAAGHGVPDESEAVLTLIGAAEGDVQARLYDTTACCTFLFMLEKDLAPSIIAWLDGHS